jgi:hypothetical protein
MREIMQRQDKGNADSACIHRQIAKTIVNRQDIWDDDDDDGHDAVDDAVLESTVHDLTYSVSQDIRRFPFLSFLCYWRRRIII